VERGNVCLIQSTVLCHDLDSWCLRVSPSFNLQVSKPTLTVSYIILQLGLAGPILQVSQTVFYEVKRMATEKLREAFAEVPEAQRHLARPVPASSNGTGEESRRRGDLVAEKVLLEK
jgi:hypothetical protein